MNSVFTNLNSNDINCESASSFVMEAVVSLIVLKDCRILAYELRNYILRSWCREKALL